MVLQQVLRLAGKRIAYALICLSGMAMGPAHAAFITYLFDAPVFTAGFRSGSPVPPPLPGSPPPPLPKSTLELPPELSNPFDVIGQRISGFVTVNDTGIDSNPDPARGTYGGFGVIPLFSATLAGNTFALDRTKPGTQSVLAVNDQDIPATPGLPASNFIQLQSLLGTGFFPEGPAANYSVSLVLSFFTQDLDIINSDALPQDLTLFSSFLLDLSILDPVSRDVMDYQARVSLTRFVPPNAVPEPTSLAVFGLGMLALLFGLHARRRA
jgi:hypothetical protein